MTKPALALFLNQKGLLLKHLLLTKPASVLLPFEHDFEGTPGVQTLFRSVSGGLIPFSLFENQFPSSNMMIVAPIRTGKSVIANHFIK